MADDSDIRAVEVWLEGEHLGNNNNFPVRLNSKSMESILDYLKYRLAGGRIYTEANSNVLMALNNWNESEGIHSEAFIKCYKSKKRFRALAPHLYRLCGWCYRATYQQSRDQCIVFMGEMGSGKTRTFDRALQFTISCFSAAAPVQAQQLLHVQTVLKAFGGVRFKESEESCRYAQLLEIEVDFKGIPEGGRLSVLPLNRSHVIEQMSSHGGFNIFYALLLGADLHLLKSIRLQRNPNFYAYLKNEASSASNSCVSADYWRKYFGMVKAALSSLGFTNAEMQDIFKLLAVILKLGNVNFRACINVDGSVGCCVDNEIEFYESADVLGCRNRDDLRLALTKRSVLQVRGESVSNNSLPDADEWEAKRQRDSTCEVLWSRLFHWLSGKLNQALRDMAPQSASGRRLRKICFLDHAGFDPAGQQRMKDYHLDRLLRNYSCERLFSHFANTEFNRLQQSYLDEGLQWCPVLEKADFGCSSLQIDQALESRGAFQRTPCANGPAISPQCCHSPTPSTSVCSGELLVNHFFGEAHYDLSNFGTENVSTIAWNCARIFYQSSNQLAKLLFPEGASLGNTSTDQKRQSRKLLSVSGQFRAALSSMLKTLEETHSTYVICVKPNDKQRPNVFDKECVERQLKNFRIPSLVRLGAAGFAYSFTYEECLDRYKMLSPLTWPRWKGGNARSGVTTILRHQEIAPSQYALGREKVFLKNTELVSILEERRNRRLHYLANVIQRAYRGWLGRGDRRSVFDRSQMIIAAYFRAYKAHKEFVALRKATIFIQTRYRGWKGRQEFTRKRKCHMVSVLCSWLKNVVTVRYLMNLIKSLPSASPLATDWPKLAPSFCRVADDQLRILYHKWRCRLYRSNVDQQAYFRMREKLAASLVFKDKKTSYPMTVAHPFRGDYVRIRQNSKWRRVAAETGDEYVVFADLVSKLHRSSGKISPELLIVSTNGIVIMDHRTLTLKHRVLVSDLVKISVSPFGDSVAVLHFKSNSLNRRSGDFVFECRHLIEVVAKMYLVVHNATGKPPFVNISPTIFIDTGSETTELLFHDRETEKDEHEEWTGCFVSTPVLPIKFSKANSQVRMMADDTSCSSTSESSGCAPTTTKLKLVKRGNRIDFYV